MDSVLSVLLKCPLFKKTPEVSKLFCDQVPVLFHKNDVIYDSEHYRRAIGILIDGKAVAKPLGNSKAVLNRFESGAVFGAAALFSADDHYVSQVIAVSDCTVVFITETELKNAIFQYPELAFNMIAFLSDRIRFLNGKLAILNQDNATGKVYAYILDHCDNDGLTGKLSLTQMGKDLSLGRTSIYRVLGDLEQNNMIKRKGKQIQVI